MNRLISCLLFLAILFTVCLLPTVDTALDAVIPYQPASAEVQNSSPETVTSDVPSAQTTPVVQLATPSPEPTPEPTPVPTPTPKPIEKGATGNDVLRAQANLIALGFMTTSPDGVYGNNTEKAVAAAKEYLNQIDRDRNGTMLSQEEMAELGLMATLAPDETVSPDAASTQRPTRPPKYGVAGNSIPYEMLAEIGDTESFPMIAKSIQRGDTGPDALRVQRRLNSLKYIHLGVDGIIGNATVDAISNFQRVNGLSQTGIADGATLEKLFSITAIENDRPLHPYKLYVRLKKQRVEVYMWNDATGEYNVPYKAFTCSTGKKGSETPAGTFSIDTGPAARWHKFSEFNCWAQYAYTIQGNILFHSVLYSKQDVKTLQKGSVRNLGKPASHGCVRLAVEDAKWIWDNCPAGTTVVIE